MTAPSKDSEAAADAASRNFIEDIIDADLAANRHDGRVVTRFPPEPNGYLHIGHAKSICLNFGLAKQFGGQCHLRFDDTNPVKEDVEFTESIQRDVQWLGFKWDSLHYASDYYETLYGFAQKLIKDGKAYVDDLSAEEIREYRGTLKEPGRPSPHRERSVDENLDLFAKMRAGEFADGDKVLRAKIDMAAPNVQLRDPAMYRIKRAHHHRTGDAWCIYPMYDFAHGLSDAIEGITHSVCTLEFENNRPLYNWFVENVGTEHTPKQYEFARLKLTYAVMSKRKLLKMVEDGIVDGWDDPRMLTVSGLRRRGYPAQAVVDFCADIGVSKNNSWIDMGRLEASVRDVLNKSAPRRMAVLEPLKVTLTDWPEGHVEMCTAKNHPGNEAFGTREIPFSGTLYIERDDFMEDAPKKFFRLAPDREVRLRYGYIIKCNEVVKDDAGNVIELRCTHDPETKGKNPSDGRKVKGTIHWVSAEHAARCEVRLYDRLFTEEHPDTDAFMDYLNRDSLTVVDGPVLEPSLVDAEPGTPVQFERKGYFTPDPKLSTPGKPVFHRIVALKDSWANMVKKGKTG